MTRSSPCYLLDASDRYTLLVQRTVLVILLIKAAVTPLPELAGLEPGLFQPPPPLNALPRGVAELFLARPVLVALKMALVSATLACFMPRWLRFMLPVVCVLATLQECIVRGFGHMNHAEIPMLLAVYVLAIASWQRDRQWNPEPLTIAIIVVATYVLTGMRRVMAGGLDVHASDAIIFWSLENGLRDSGLPFGWGTLIANYPAVWPWMKASFTGITALEIAGPWCFVSAWFRRLYFVGMLGFQLGTLLIMNIAFWENMVLLIVLFAVPELGVAFKKQFGMTPRSWRTSRGR